MKLQQLRSSTKGSAPLAKDLEEGQLALNINPDSPAIYIRDSGGIIRKLAGANAVGHTTVNGKDGNVILDAEDVGLEKVDNTADADKPISDATEGALKAKADLVDGKILPGQIPAIAISLF